MPKTDCRSSTGTSSSDSPSDDTSSDEPEALSPDDIFHILQTNRRRDAISYLLDREGPVKMSDIAEHVSAKEHETTVAELTSTQRQRVYIPLYQSHLPKLDEKGVIDYNKPRGIVRPTERIEEFRPYLEAAESNSSPDQEDSDADDGRLGRAFGGSQSMLTGASVGLLAASVSGLFVIPNLALAAIIMLLFVFATITTNAAASTTSSGNTRLSQ
ncbi:hypothetical protein [Haloterrigena salinisoli]|uniref:DUF7344 domain-containing protein n=1 Tax=Haloterrigena salinisoli TaxID=3132747 RepID=UPI0030CADEE1